MKSAWHSHTLSVLSDIIGPAADLIIDLSFNNMSENAQKMSSSRHYLEFLKQLKKILPGDISPETIAEKLWLTILDKHVFS